MKYVLLEKTIFVSLDGKQITVPKSDERFNDLQKLLKKKNIEKAKEVLMTKKNFGEDIEVINGLITYKGHQLPSFLGDHFLSFKIDKKPLIGLINFWLNLKNRKTIDESKEIVQSFLKLKAYSITNDGFFIVYLGSTFGHSIDSDYFFDYSRTQRVPWLFNMFENQKTLNEILEDVFGFKGKKLEKKIKALAFNQRLVNPKPFLVGKLFKGVLSNDNILSILEYPVKERNEESLKSLRDFLSLFTEKKILSFLSKDPTGEGLARLAVILEQVAKQKEGKNILKEFKKRKFKSFGEMEEFFKEYAMFFGKKKEKLSQITNFKNLKKIKRDLGNGYRIEIPKNNFDLIKYSFILGNCIKDYTARVQRKEVLLLAIYKEEKLLYNISVRDNKISEFKGLKNSDVLKSDKPEKKKEREMVLAELKRAKVID